MNRLGTLTIALLLTAPLAHAKLPPPTPEQVAAQQQRRADEEARLAKEKEALERVQDRIAERYRATRAAQSAASVDKADLPQATKQQPGTAAPEGGRRQSAEAHSAPAK